MRNGLIYLDNAATSFPKPAGVIEAMEVFMRKSGANPGRSGHRLSIEAGRVVFELRERIAELFGFSDSSRVVYCLNATEAINLGLKGILKKGDHVITSSVEHNSVMRPLRALQREEIDVTVVPCNPRGQLDPEDIRKSIKKNSRMVILTHASNVAGTILPVGLVGEICRSHGILFMLDAAQTAGVLPINMEKENIDLLAFTGHKALFGPQGTGGLVIGKAIEDKTFQPLKRGGTGSRSELEEQPDFFPDLCESGTLNTVGLAGLRAGVEFILETGIDKIRACEKALAFQLIKGMQKIPEIIVYGPTDAENQCATVSFNIKGWSPSDLGFRLDEEFGILTRVGLHCAPSAHKTIGTFPGGTVRASMSYLNTEQEIDHFLEALSILARKGA
jgi:cysteine desulfurase family protein